MPSTSSTPTKEAASTPTVLFALRRIEGRHGLPRLRVQERSHLPDDLRPRRGRQQANRVRRVGPPHDLQSQFHQ